MHVVVSGAGPCGLLVALQLQLAGIRCTVLERAAESQLEADVWAAATNPNPKPSPNPYPNPNPNPNPSQVQLHVVDGEHDAAETERATRRIVNGAFASSSWLL